MTTQVRGPAMAALLAMVVAGVGCKAAGEDARQCNVHADCASGECGADGYCVGVDPGQDGGEGDATTDHDEVDGEGMDAAPDVEPDVDPGVCKPNLDGTITAAEMPLGPGFTAMFRISEDVSPFNSAPDCTTGNCFWDFVDVGGTTREEETGTVALTNQWYAQSAGLENATYVSRMAEVKLGFGGVTICDQVQFGVFQVTPEALLMLGLVSEYEEGGTKLIYDPPLPMLKFPMTVGSAWKVDTVANGPLCNSMVDYHINQTFDFSVDRIGSMATPYGTFEEVLRVNSLMERQLGVGVTATKVRTHTYVAECFTTIAAVVSQEGESNPDFGAAAEVRRLTNLP